jgi:hypothetical protein
MLKKKLNDEKFVYVPWHPFRMLICDVCIAGGRTITCNVPRYILYNVCSCYIVSELYHCTQFYLLVCSRHQCVCVCGLRTCRGVSSVIYKRGVVCAAIWCRVRMKCRILGMSVSVVIVDM